MKRIKVHQDNIAVIICILFIIFFITLCIFQFNNNREYDQKESQALSENLGKPIDIECCIAASCTVYKIGGPCGKKCIAYCERGILTPKEGCGQYVMANPYHIINSGCMIKEPNIEILI